jgi:hypothetical protein
MFSFLFLWIIVQFYQQLGHVASDSRMAGELARIQKEASMAEIEVLWQILSGGIE